MTELGVYVIFWKSTGNNGYPSIFCIYIYLSRKWQNKLVASSLKPRDLGFFKMCFSRFGRNLKNSRFARNICNKDWYACFLGWKVICNSSALLLKAENLKKKIQESSSVGTEEAHFWRYEPQCNCIGWIMIKSMQRPSKPDSKVEPPPSSTSIRRWHCPLVRLS